MENERGINRYEWDQVKRLANLDKHGVDFASIVGFDWENAIIQTLNHPDEVRYRAIGVLDGDVHVVIYTLRPPNIRLISMWHGGSQDWRRYVRA